MNTELKKNPIMERLRGKLSPEDKKFVEDYFNNLDRTPSPSGGIKTAEQLAMHWANKEGYEHPSPYYSFLEGWKAHNQFAGDGWIENIISHLSDKIEPGADKQYFGSEYTKGRNDAFRLVIGLLKKHLPSPPQNTKES